MSDIVSKGLTASDIDRWYERLRGEAQRHSARALVELMRLLRSDRGCPWDRAQTPSSLRPYLLEECYEALEALDRGEPEAVCEELGDLLLQIVFHAQLADEAGHFDLDDVIEGITRKMIRRHPHVFGDRLVDDAEEVLANWELDKLAGAAGGRRRSLLDGIPAALPALTRAQRVQQRAAGVGFDWPSIQGPLAKIREELDEIRGLLAADGSGPSAADALEDEVGDLLFAVVNLARKLGLDAESALRRATDKFSRRFLEVEAGAGEALGQMGLDELDELWRRAKETERGER